MDNRGVTAIEYGLIAALIAVVTIAVVSLVGTTLETTFNPTPIPWPTVTVVPPSEEVRIEILSPTKGSTVARETSVIGVLDAPPSFSNLWLFTVGPDNLYYPQWPIPPGVGGMQPSLWLDTIKLDRLDGACTEIAIFAVAADGEAHEALRAQVEQQVATRGYPLGFDDLPIGAKWYYDIVTVTYCP